MPSKMVLGVW